MQTRDSNESFASRTKQPKLLAPCCFSWCRPRGTTPCDPKLMRLKTRDTVFRLEFLCPHAVRIWWTPWWPPGHGLSFFVHTALVSEKSVLLFLAISPSACSTLHYAGFAGCCVGCGPDGTLRFEGSDGHPFRLDADGIVEMLNATPVPPQAVILNACSTQGIANFVKEHTRAYVTMGWVGRVPGGQCLAMVRAQGLCSQSANVDVVLICGHAPPPPPPPPFFCVSLHRRSRF
jgi:hypothetical protein